MPPVLRRYDDVGPQRREEPAFVAEEVARVLELGALKPQRGPEGVRDAWTE